MVGGVVAEGLAESVGLLVACAVLLVAWAVRVVVVGGAVAMVAVGPLSASLSELPHAVSPTSRHVMAAQSEQRFVMFRVVTLGSVVKVPAQRRMLASSGMSGPCGPIQSVLTVDRGLEQLYPSVFHDLSYCVITGPGDDKCDD